MKAYKVVTEDRKSVVVGQGYYENFKYQLEYPIGKIVESISNSLGIFCFRFKWEADIYKAGEDLQIVKVEGINRLRIPNIIIGGFAHQKEFDKFYLDPSNFRGATERIIKGTILFQSVKVLN